VGCRDESSFWLSFLGLASHCLQLKFEHFPRCLKLNNVVLNFVHEAFQPKVNFFMNEQHTFSKRPGVVHTLTWRNENRRDSVHPYQKLKSMSESQVLHITVQAKQSVLKSITELRFVTWTELTSCKRFDNNCYHLLCIAMNRTIF